MKLTAITNIALLSGVTSGRAFGPDRVRARQAMDNLQTFEGDVGSAAPAIKMSGSADRPFEVNGAAFQSLDDAATRSCDVQFNSCANEANAGAGDVAFADCTVQKDDCLASAQDTAENGSNAGADAAGVADAPSSTDVAPDAGATGAANASSSTVAAVAADATGAADTAGASDVAGAASAVDANGAADATGAVDGAEEDESSSSDESSSEESSSDEDEAEESTGIASNTTMAAVNATAATNSTGFANRLLKARGLRPNSINNNADVPANGAKLNPLRARVDRVRGASNEEATQEKPRGRVVRRSL